MAGVALPWLSRPGLAGGIDKDGGRAAELLGLGFGSVEFGSVTMQAVAGYHAGVALLTHRLSQLDRSVPGRTAIGIGLGQPPEATAETLADEWLAGLAAVWPVADYVSLNLSAKANQRFLAPEHRASLIDALRRVASCRDRLAEAGRNVALAVKMPLREAASLLETLSEFRFEQLTVVLPDSGERFPALAKLRATTARPALVAIGSIRSAADIADARAAGAAGVQVHRLFVEQGAGCLAELGEVVV